MASTDKLNETDRFVVILGTVLIVIAGVILGFYWARLPEELPWLYSLPWGGSQLINKLWFGVFLLGLGITYCLNVFISLRLRKRDIIWMKIVLYFSLGIVVVYLVSFYRVLSLIL